MHRDKKLNYTLGTMQLFYPTLWIHDRSLHGRVLGFYLFICSTSVFVDAFVEIRVKKISKKSFHDILNKGFGEAVEGNLNHRINY